MRGDRDQEDVEERGSAAQAGSRARLQARRAPGRPRFHAEAFPRGDAVANGGSSGLGQGLARHGLRGYGGRGLGDGHEGGLMAPSSS